MSDGDLDVEITDGELELARIHSMFRPEAVFHFDSDEPVRTVIGGEVGYVFLGSYVTEDQIDVDEIEGSL